MQPFWSAEGLNTDRCPRKGYINENSPTIYFPPVSNPFKIDADPGKIQSFHPRYPNLESSTQLRTFPYQILIQHEAHNFSFKTAKLQQGSYLALGWKSFPSARTRVISHLPKQKGNFRKVLELWNKLWASWCIKIQYGNVLRWVDLSIFGYRARKYLFFPGFTLIWNGLHTGGKSTVWQGTGHAQWETTAVLG